MQFNSFILSTATLHASMYDIIKNTNLPICAVSLLRNHGEMKPLACIRLYTSNIKIKRFRVLRY